MDFKNKKGQALVEVIIGLFVFGILMGSLTAGIVAALRSSSESKNSQAASALSQQLIDNVKSVADANWFSIYNLTKGTSTQYYTAASGTTLAVFSGTTTTIVGNVTYTKFFSVENASRLSGVISTDGGATNDPSTQKITSHTQWPAGGQTSEVAVVSYLTRWRNRVSQQTDWSGGSGQSGPITEFSNQFASSTGIDYSSSSSICLQGYTCGQ